MSDRLVTIVRDKLRAAIRTLRADDDRQAKTTLLAEVKSFHKASRTGEYYV